MDKAVEKIADRDIAIRAVEAWLTRNPYRERNAVAEKIVCSLGKLGYRLPPNIPELRKKLKG